MIVFYLLLAGVGAAFFCVLLLVIRYSAKEDVVFDYGVYHASGYEIPESFQDEDSYVGEIKEAC